MKRGFGFSLMAAAGLAACAHGPKVERSQAPEPLKQISETRLFSGRWYEIARTPEKLTNDCVAGTTDYYRAPDGQLTERDTCRLGTPEGKEKVFFGPVHILNPGDNTKVTVQYKVAAVFYIPKSYWMLDHAADYSWFIVSDPDLTTLSILTRSPRPNRDLVLELVDRAKSLGFNAKNLEFPLQFPPGEGELAAAGSVN